MFSFAYQIDLIPLQMYNNKENVKHHYLFRLGKNMVLCNSSLQNVENDVLSTLFGF